MLPLLAGRREGHLEQKSWRYSEWDMAVCVFNWWNMNINHHYPNGKTRAFYIKSRQQCYIDRSDPSSWSRFMSLLTFWCLPKRKNRRVRGSRAVGPGTCGTGRNVEKRTPTTTPQARIAQTNFAISLVVGFSDPSLRQPTSPTPYSHLLFPNPPPANTELKLFDLALSF